MSTVFQIDLSGLNAADRLRLLAGAGAHGYTPATSDQAQASVLDGDQAHALLRVDELRARYPQRPILVVSRKPVQLRQVTHVAPPLTPTRLGHLLRSLITPQSTMTPSAPVAAARQLEQDTVHELCGTAADADLSDPAALSARQYDPGHYVQGVLIQAWATGKPTLVNAGGHSIVLDPASWQAITAFGHARLRGLSVMPLQGPQHWQAISGEQAARALADPRGTPMELDALVWKSALWASRGRLPVDVDPFQPVRLTHWPNLSRLPQPPHALRVLALWEARATSPIDTAHKLGIAQRYVFACYSAARALHLLRGEPRADAAPPVAAPAERGLFRRLLGALRGAV